MTAINFSYNWNLQEIQMFNWRQAGLTQLKSSAFDIYNETK